MVAFNGTGFVAVLLGVASLMGATDAIAQDRVLDEFTAPVEAFEFGPAFDAPADKMITLLTCGAIGEGCQYGAEAAADAAANLGWRTRIVDGKFDPAVWNQSVQQAVIDGADGIIVFAITPALIQGGLDAAREAGVPIITVYQPRFEGVPEVDGYVTGDHAKGGIAAAELITEDSDGAATVLVFDAPQFPELMKRNNATADALAEICAGCTVLRQEFNAAQAPQRMATLVANQVQANAGVDYILAPYDAIGAFVALGLRQVGKSDSVKVVSFEGNPTGIDLVGSGELYANIAAPLNFSGWIAIDTMARILAGAEYADYVEFPQRVFLSGGELPAEAWEPEFDYRAELKALWR